ncbi:Retrotransposon protein, Ty3-gypsy subclass [Phytophthora palmivora]|uniref:Retrotransposon protein, Ty3-gypsy subclass n=1 Tax=Phytophthora palmivora TaxID=4796 RepID=A0A2P4XFZ8_9STRA|nr:Retrotransposon protein, Ty3-gypsy subclass [Phytophthora palmivora]
MIKHKERRHLDWSSENITAFERLKSALSETPVLALSDFTKPFYLRTDALRFAIGGVLHQLQTTASDLETHEQPIAFCGRKLKAAELNNPTHEQKMLAIIHCLNMWRDGGYTVETDHHSLERVLSGSTNTVADALSRRPDFEIDFEQHMRKQMHAGARLKPLTPLTLIRSAQRQAGWTQAILKDENSDKLKYDPDQMFYHDIPTSGHPGIEKTIDEIKSRLYWKRMHKTIRKYIATCEPCQRNKRRTGKPPDSLHPLEFPTGRWTSIGTDFMTGLPATTAEHDTILVTSHFIPTISTITAPKLAELFVEKYVRRHGIPVDIVSDRYSKFTSKFWGAYAEILGTKLKMASAYHLRTDGQVERLNDVLTGYLRHYVSGFHIDWDKHRQQLTDTEDAADQACDNPPPTRDTTHLDGFSLTPKYKSYDEAFQRVQGPLVKGLKDAVTRGLSEHGLHRMKASLEKYADNCVYILQGPPVKVNPLKVRRKADGVPVTWKARRYPLLHSIFLDANNNRSQWCSPPRFVPKTSVEELRMTIDTRAVNACTEPVPFPIPQPEVVISHVEEATVFFSCDWFKGY